MSKEEAETFMSNNQTRGHLGARKLAPGGSFLDAVLGGFRKPQKTAKNRGPGRPKIAAQNREGYMPGRPHLGGPALTLEECS